MCALCHTQKKNTNTNTRKRKTTKSSNARWRAGARPRIVQNRFLCSLRQLVSLKIVPLIASTIERLLCARCCSALGCSELHRRHTKRNKTQPDSHFSAVYVYEQSSRLLCSMFFQPLKRLWFSSIATYRNICDWARRTVAIAKCNG